MSLSLRVLARNASTLFAGGLGNAALAFLQGIIVARTLEPAGYGTWGVMLSTCALLRAFLSFRTQEPLTRFLVHYHQAEDQSRLKILIGASLWVEGLACLLAFGLVVIFAPLAARLTPGIHENLPMIYRIYALTLLLSPLDTVWYCIARDQRRFYLLAMLPPVVTALQCLGIAALWATKALDLLHLAFLFVFLSILQFIYYMFCLQKAFQKHFGIKGFGQVLEAGFAHWRELGEFWSFMRSTYFASSATSIIKNCDMLILAYFRNPAEAGWYRLAKSMASMVQMLAISLTSAIYRDFVELSHKDPLALRHKIVHLMKFWIPLIIAGTVTGLFLAKPVLLLFYGEAYLNSVLLFQIMMIGCAFGLIFFWGQPLVLASGMHRHYLWLCLAGSVLTLILITGMTAAFGSTGTAFAATCFWSLLPAIFAKLAFDRLQRIKIS